MAPQPKAAQAKAKAAPPPTPRTTRAAAARQQDQATQLLDVLDLVLQCAPAPLLQDVKQFCRLQQVSKAVAAAAAQHCAGQLKVSVELRTAHAVAKAAPWIARHAHLVGDLHVAAGPGPYQQTTTDAAATRAAVLEAFQQAVAAQADNPAAPEDSEDSAAPAAPEDPAAPAVSAGEARLRMHKLLLAGTPAIAADLLQLAGGTQLTELTLCVGWPAGDMDAYFGEPDEDDEDDAPGDMARLVETVAGLPSLQRLSLTFYQPALFQCLPRLSTLTHFCCDCMIDTDAVLPLLPSQLLDLDLFVMDGFRSGQSDLQRYCPSLTDLHLGAVNLANEAKLPASLQVLAFDTFRSAAPLLALTQLRELTLFDTPPAARLRQLTALTSLTSIKLMASRDSAANSSEAWGELPLRELAACLSPPFSAHVRTLSNLGSATRLTRLELELPGDSAQAMGQLAQPLAAALPRLQSLQELKLFKGYFGNAGAAPAASRALEAKMAALATAIVGLPRLQSLSVTGFSWGDAAQQLAGAGTQLTCVTIGKGYVSRASLAAILTMAQLRSLHLINVDGLTDARLKVAGQHLRHLTRLSFSGAASLTLLGVKQLAELPSLDELAFWSDGAQGYAFNAADVRGALIAAGGCAPHRVTVTHHGA